MAWRRWVLPEAHSSVDEEGVVLRAGGLRRRQGGRVGEAVGLADDEGVERVLAHEAGRRRASLELTGPALLPAGRAGAWLGALGGAGRRACRGTTATGRGGRRPAPRQRSSGSWWSRFGHHDDLAIHGAAHHLGHRVGDEGAKARVDPVLGEVRGDPDRIDPVGEAQAGSLSEPDVERTLVDLLRDELESLLPDGVAVASLHGRPPTSLQRRPLDRRARRPSQHSVEIRQSCVCRRAVPAGPADDKARLLQRHQVPISGRGGHAQFLGDAGRTDRCELDRQQQNLKLALREIICRGRGRRERSFRRAVPRGR